MKKILFILLALSFFQGMQAQRYRINLALHFRTNDKHMECSTRANVTITYADGSTDTRTYTVPGEMNENRSHMEYDIIYTDKIVRKINCVGTHRDNTTGFWTKCKDHCSGSAGGYIYDSDYPCVNKRYTKFFGKDDGGTYIDMKITPVNFSIDYSANGLVFKDGEKTLPDTKKIKLTAPAGYHKSVYHWTYLISGGGGSGDVPAAFQSADGSSVEFSGNELISNFIDFVNMGKNIAFQIDYGCGSTNTQSLTPTICAPEIVSAEGIPLSCGEDASGQFRVELSRPFYPEEIPNFTVTAQYTLDHYDDFHYGKSYLKIDPENPKIVTFPHFDRPGAELWPIPPGIFMIDLTDYFRDEKFGAYTDDSGQFSWSNIEIKAPVPVEFDGAITITPITCPGGSDGAITLKAKGGNENYIVKLFLYGEDEPFLVSEPFQGETTISGLSENDYDIYLYDTAGCKAEGFEPVLIEGPDEYFEIHTVSMETASLDENLQEESNGSIRIVLYNEYNSYHYIWRAGDKDGAVLLDEESDDNASTLENINSGTYYVEVINPNGCSIDSLIVLPRAPDITFSIVQTANIFCSGDNTGELEATVTGGVAPYTYSWYAVDEYTGEKTPTGSDSPVLSGITAGGYQLSIQDANGSKARSPIVYQTEENPISAVFDTQYLSCYSDANGFLEISVSGGTAPYTYLWGNSSTGTRIENLSAGSYEVIVTDAAGCFRRFVGVVSAPSRLKMSPSIGHPSCAGAANGYINLTISGGNAPYSIEWSTGSVQPNLSGLSAGEYHVKITDGHLCEILNETFILDEPTAISITQTYYKPVTAFGQTDGMFSISIEGGTTPYTITCVRNGSQSISSQSRQVQSDGSVLVNYANLSVGDYVVSLTDRNNCSADFSITVSEPPPLSVNIQETHPITCYRDSDGALLAVGQGGETDSPIPYRYEWYRVEGYQRMLLSTGTNSLSGLSEGVYTVKITDKNNISVFSPDYKLLSPDTLTLGFDIEDVTCAGGSNGSIVSLVDGGGGVYSYSWNSGETSPAIFGKSSGTYQLTVTDDRGCSVSSSAEIMHPVDFAINYEVMPLSCYGNDDGAIYLEIVGGNAPYEFLWSNGSDDPFVESLAPGAYSVYITDAKACITDTTFVIPALDSIKVSLLELKQPIGFGYSDGSITVEISGGNTPPYHNIVWSNAAGDTLTAEPAVYTDNQAVSVLKNLPEGYYYLRIEDVNYPLAIEWDLDPCGCMDSLSFYMPQPPKLEVSIQQQREILCFGSNEGAITSSAEGGVPFTAGLPYLYEWERDGQAYVSGLTDLTELIAGVYRLKITDANGIFALSDPVELSQPDSLSLRFATADIKCSRDQTGWAEVTVSGGVEPYTYEWSNGGTASRIENVSRGKYMVWVRDANNCETTGIVEIVQANSIMVKAELTQPSCFGGSDGRISITLSKGEPPYSYSWESGLQSLVYTGLAKGSYTFTVSDVHECGYEVETYELGEPEQYFVDLGADRELCKGQTLTVKASAPVSAHSYTWFGPGGQTLHTGEEFTLSEAGTYRVEAVTDKGCAINGKINITRDDRDISADFMVATKVPIYEEVYAVNIAFPEPESIEWVLPEKSGYELIAQNDQVLTLIFSEYGEFTIGMKCYSGNCWETVYKTLTVMDKIDIPDYEDADEPMLKSFTISPNPAESFFFVSIELKEASPVDLYLINTGTGAVVASKRLEGSKDYRAQFSVPLSRQGTYVLSLLSPKAKAVRKLIL
ncbi:MAG: hypothetical protein LBU22_09700 [Dysgonamonadaceae bacterium]|jgi:hypothetical protein|nr:hypothetical protein [Dysgonamonadaceae bacterium]